MLNKQTKILMMLILLLVFTLFTMPYLEGWSLWQTVWWFIITSTTIGYGDLSPTTEIGQAIAIIILLVSLNILGVVFSQIAHNLIKNENKKMKGLGNVTYKNHIIILGWNDTQTEDMISEIISDTLHKNKKIVLCSDVLNENPMPDKITFIKGEISKNDTLRRANINDADKIMIYGNSDQHTIFATLAADALNREDLTITADIVVYINDDENLTHIKRIQQDNDKIRVVTSNNIHLMVQEMQDPGVGELFEILASNKTDRTVYRLKVPNMKFNYFDFCSILNMIGLYKHIKPFGYTHNNTKHVMPFEANTINVNENNEVYVYVVDSDRPHLDWELIKTSIESYDY